MSWVVNRSKVLLRHFPILKTEQVTRNMFVCFTSNFRIGKKLVYVCHYCFLSIVSFLTCWNGKTVLLHINIYAKVQYKIEREIKKERNKQEQKERKGQKERRKERKKDGKRKRKERRKKEKERKKKEKQRKIK